MASTSSAEKVSGDDVVVLGENLPPRTAAKRPKKAESEAGPSNGKTKQKAGGKKPQSKKSKLAEPSLNNGRKVPAQKGRKSKAQKEEEEVNRLLLLPGYKNPEKSSKCVRAGLIRGHFGFEFTGEAAQLDKVVLRAKCKTMENVCDLDENCPGTLKATVRQLLEQPDYGGNDYEDGLRNAKVICDTCRKNRSYVTDCCDSTPEWDCGKFHNHCTDCKGLGQCLGDYREAHCFRCGKHYFAGSGGRFPCSCSSKSRSDGCDVM